MLYERIEERGLDYVLRKYSQRQRDDILRNTCSEDLVMYSVIGLTTKELIALFSKSVVRKEFSRLPPENLFYCDSFHALVNVRPLFQEMDTSTFLSEYRKTPAVLFQLLDSRAITRSDVLQKLAGLTLMRISALRSYHYRFEEVWVVLREMVTHCVFPIRRGTAWKEPFERCSVREAAVKAYSRDLARYIVEFI